MTLVMTFYDRSNVKSYCMVGSQQTGDEEGGRSVEFLAYFESAMQKTRHMEEM